MEAGPKRRDIQGLRAIAIGAVVVYHAFPSWLPGGFVGVDVFFVISGFVITRSILKGMKVGEFTIAGFYRRRVRRIFPALYAMLAAVVVASWFLLSPRALQELGTTGLSTAFFASNVSFMNLGYFDGASEYKPLLHTWSLAVEEQFYLVYPVFVFLVRRFRPRLLRPALGVILLLSLVLSDRMLARSPTAAFYLAPSRAFELLLGALVACSEAKARVPRPVRHALSILGLAMVAGAFALYGPRTPFPGLAALVPCVGTTLVIWAGVGEASAGGQLLSSAPFQWLGELSYSLYLWHWPVLVLARDHLGGALDPITRIGCVAGAVAAASVSLHLLERPILDARRARLPFLRLGAAVMAGASAVCLALILGGGAPSRFSPAALALFASADDYNHRRNECHEGDRPIPYDKTCVFGAKGSEPDVALWGDSHGAELVVALGERLEPSGRSALQITSSGCPPALNFDVRGRPRCRAHNAATLDALLRDPRVRTVVLVTKFSRYESEDFESYLSGYAEAVEALARQGKRVVLVDPIPTMDFDPPSVLGTRASAGKPFSDVGIDVLAFRRDNARALSFLDGLSAALPVVRVSPEHALCEDGRCRVYSAKNGPLYFNPDHLSLAGARVLGQAVPL